MKPLLTQEIMMSLPNGHPGSADSWLFLESFLLLHFANHRPTFMLLLQRDTANTPTIRMSLSGLISITELSI
jgi:hypothetical protein